ncbi:MAG: hypothetical protein AAFR21_11645 [Pseudomonadota bacterium]
MKSFNSTLIAVAALSLTFGSAHAFSPEDGQIVASVYNDLKAAGYSVENFDDLSMGEIMLIKSQMDGGKANPTLINGLLSGDCHGHSVLSHDDIRALTN